MRVFSVIYLMTLTVFADTLFPYSAIGLGVWIILAATLLYIQEKLSD
jgi:hypothetical protein